MAELQIRGFGEMEIGGAVRPFHLGTYQARVFCERRNVELAAYQQAVSALTGSAGLQDQVLLCDLLYSALTAGAKLTKQPIEFDADDVTFWVDAADLREVGKLFSVAAALADTGPAPGKAPGPQLKK